MQFWRPFDFSGDKFQMKSSTHKPIFFTPESWDYLSHPLVITLVYMGKCLSFRQWSLCRRKEKSPFWICIDSSKCPSTRTAFTWCSGSLQSWYEFLKNYICLNIFSSFLKIKNVIDYISVDPLNKVKCIWTYFHLTA